MKRTKSDGFSDEQRKWIRNRDGNVCQLCGDAKDLHVHHISPWRYSASVLHWTLERVNAPTNGITLCKMCHIGDENSIHPDIARASRTYHTNKNSYSDVFAERDNLCRRQMPYWNVAYDNQMAVTAMQNTLRYVSEGNYPTPWTKEDA